MAYPCAGIDVVVAEAGADQLLDQECFFIGAARRRDAANGVLAVLGLDALELGSRIAEGLVPRYFAPGVRDFLADHRLEDALFMGRVAPGKPALDARVAAIALAIFVGDHADQLVTAHFRLERA